MALLGPRQIALALKAVPEWSKRSRAIRRTFAFDGFSPAIAFVNRVARAAEAADHHPDIDVRWNKVTLVLATHSEGGLTRKDFAMARRCDALVRGRR